MTKGKHDVWRYNAGTCHEGPGGSACQECRDDHARYSRETRQRRAERLAADPSAAPHGDPNTYMNWDCRCAACCEAASKQQHARRHPGSLVDPFREWMVA
jgi:hypothetical protein